MDSREVPSQDQSGSSQLHHPPSITRAGGAAGATQFPSSLASKRTTRDSMTFSFPPLFQPNTSSTSLVPSTAEGKPIPLDDSTAAHRTSALRELNSNYPSRHRYAKSTGAQSSTYSQPVIVRTYSGSHSRPTSTNRSNGVSGGGLGSRTASSVVSGPAASVRRIIALRTPFSGNKSTQHGGLSMARGMAKKRLEGQDALAKLPPVEAYSFKSMMANIEAQEGENNINADLDRIAEICARSRYSLSNQYEVHVAPHGSGASFVSHASSSRRQRQNAGPTLEAVVSDDERRHKKRRSGGRRRSIAMGTLETIMSSSRSSEEDKSKKKSAAEITAEVRGRTARKTSGSTSPTSSASEGEGPLSKSQQDQPPPLVRRKSSSFATAMLESTRQGLATNTASPRSSATGLVSEPALPKTSTSHLEVRTDVEENVAHRHAPKGSDERPRAAVHEPQHCETSAQVDQMKMPTGLLAGLTGWVPWRLPPIVGLGSASAQGGVSRSHAEGSLRELLKTTDFKSKGKAVEGQS
ncbi:uncharacterized protein ColSpa_01037 [Colletotrichum spaethianum]|uniref:Uncharacterized protein n=1 Tax=Colletotrichum spaethianum TaxID=700344 RepID=A0AA37L2M7_9PEZI|nr:uncharacterized protein ColSpa_01037 [Colletotrichum spaethianum]GKT40856.1 hypothetical protein ColSpa_01037 [Colletotrichum spaethianum]